MRDLYNCNISANNAKVDIINGKPLMSMQERREILQNRLNFGGVDP